MSGLDAKEAANYSSIYTVPVTVGSNNQTFQLQVDTGSSDLVCIHLQFFPYTFD